MDDEEFKRTVLKRFDAADRRFGTAGQRLDGMGRRFDIVVSRPDAIAARLDQQDEVNDPLHGRRPIASRGR